ncbi:MAG TPA: hypothetical protein VFG76_06115 [Candidatus Polarisedimenticolia bacterium]|nr:hypothetical protein [Candidatus Polarisedimenticolia bacterium]
MSNSLLKLDIKELKLPKWLSFGAPANSGGGGMKAKYPPVAFEIGASRMSLARLTAEKSQGASLTSFDVIDVPPDLIESDVFKLRIKSPQIFSELVTGALAKEGVKTGAISLVLPDHLARVSLLPFEELPRTRRDVVELVKWKMRKAVPFKVEEAALDYQILPSNGHKGFTLLTVLMPGSIIEEQESIFQAHGIHAGLIDLSSFSLVHLYRSIIEQEVPAGGDFMLLNMCPEFFAVLIFRAGHLIFYRCKTFAADVERRLEDDYRLARREIQGSLVYYQEKLDGKELSRIYTRVVGLEPSRVASLFEGVSVAAVPEVIDVQRAVNISGRLLAMGPERAGEILQRLAPAVGAALGRNGREA